MEIDYRQKSLLLEESEIRKDERLQAAKALRKRWILLNAILMSLVVSLLTLALVWAHQYHNKLLEIQLIDSQITQTQTKLQEAIENKTISLHSESNLSKIHITSINDFYTTKPSIRHLNLSGTTITTFNKMIIPTLVTMDLPSTVDIFQEIEAGIIQFHTQFFKNIYRVYDCQFNQLQKLDIRNAKISVISSVRLMSVKQIYLGNSGNFLIQGVFPQLQYLGLYQLMEMSNINIKAGMHLNNIDCRNCACDQFSLNKSNIKNLLGMCNFKNIKIYQSPLSDLGCQQFPKLEKIYLGNVSFKHFMINAPLIKVITLESSSIETFGYTHNPQKNLPYLVISNSTVIRIQNITHSFTHITFENNLFLEAFCNNSMNMTHIIQFFGTKLKSFCQNYLPNLNSIYFVVSPRVRNYMQQFTNNNLSSLKMLSLEQQALSRITGNDFRSLQFLNLSCNKMDDMSVEALIRENNWNQNILKSVDLTYNDIKRKQHILGLFKDALPYTSLII